MFFYEIQKSKLQSYLSFCDQNNNSKFFLKFFVRVIFNEFSFLHRRPLLVLLTDDIILFRVENLKNRAAKKW